jgi:hypothetical protein
MGCPQGRRDRRKLTWLRRCSRAPEHASSLSHGVAGGQDRPASSQLLSTAFRQQGPLVRRRRVLQELSLTAAARFACESTEMRLYSPDRLLGIVAAL